MNGSLGNKRRSEIGSKRRRRLLKQQDEEEEEQQAEEEDNNKREKKENKNMVAISMYRGNMHRVAPEVPRRWLMPKPQISPKDFRNLLLRRSKALSTTATSPPPNPNSLKEKENDDDKKEKEKEKEKEKAPEKVADVHVTASQGGQKQDPIVDEEKEKRKKEVEDKLHVLNEKKHNLVQALKQILNAEEELKRRSNVQAGRPPLPIQLDASNDSGSMTRHATPRTGSEANAVVDMEGGEGEDASNPNPQGRQLLRVNSTSPSAESALRRPPYFQHNVGTHPSRAAVVVSGSPSRFAPSGNQSQSHPPNLPTVSVTGTNYVASSPSPAASGGTSGFRDARHPSPWN